MSWTLVTGGAKNLGASISKSLAKAGYPVVVHYRHSKAEAEAIVKECRSFGVEAAMIQGDFSTTDSTLRFIEEYRTKFPETTGLINNVGEYLLGSSLHSSEEQMLQLYQTNLHAPYLFIKELLPTLHSVVNIGVAGLNAMHAETYATAYYMTKSSLLLLTKSLAKELAAQNIRLNMVSPGYLENSVDLPSDITTIPMGRAAQFGEVADLVVYLLSDKAQYITGQNIEIAGGTRL